MRVWCEKCGHTGQASIVGSTFKCEQCGSRSLRKVQYCKKCGHVGVPDIETDRKISVGLLLVLLALGIIPGVIYVLMGGTSQEYYACTECRGRDVLIPFDSPIAQAELGKS